MAEPVQERSTFDTALYAPHIQFQDINWLKCALLYWERICRIVPSEYHTWDPDDIKRAKDEGCIEDIPPDGYVSAAAHTFNTRVAPALRHVRNQMRSQRGDVFIEALSAFEVHPGKILSRQDAEHRRVLLLDLEHR